MRGPLPGYCSVMIGFVVAVIAAVLLIGVAEGASSRGRT